MRITVLLFGPQAQRAGRRQVVVELPGTSTTCAELRKALAEAVPELATSLPNSRLAVNHAYADDNERITASDEVALIGMVSGG
ncbi:MAG TPA: MoaD/ThiS family protein [Phycisphaeraceae bacterium]